MDSRYSFSATMPQHENQTSQTMKNSSESSLQNNVNPPTSTSTRYFHRAPLIFPQHHQQRLRTSSPRFSSSYLGPLNQHRSRFLSAWDLTPRPHTHNSSRQPSATTPTPTSLPEQFDEDSLSVNNNSLNNPIANTPTPSTSMSNPYEDGSQSSRQSMRSPGSNILSPTPSSTLIPKQNDMGFRSPKLNMQNSSRNTIGIASAPKSITKQHDENSHMPKSPIPRSSIPKSTRNTISSNSTSTLVPKQHDENSRSSRTTLHNSPRQTTATTQAVPSVPQQYVEDRTQLQTMPAKDFADLVMLPREWRRGEVCIPWARNHDYYNISWLENLWKYINEKLPNDLTTLENTNILYLQPLSRSSSASSSNNTISLYKLSKDIGLIQLPTVPSKDDLAIQKVLVKLNFHCIEPFPEIIRRHKLIDEYVPQLSCLGLLQIFKCRLRHFTQLKIQHEFNTLLNEHDMKLLRQYLSRIMTQQLDDSNIQCIKQLPIFDNAYLGNESNHYPQQQQQQHYKYISLNNILYIYESGIKLPIDLQPPKQCIHVTDSDSRILLDKLGYVIHDFTHVARYLITTIGQQQQLNIQQPQTPPTINLKNDHQKMLYLGKWLLVNCSNLILTDAVCQDTLSTCRLFLNRKGEICSCQQMFDPSSFHNNNKDKYLSLFELKYLPSQDLCSTNETLPLLKHLKLRQYYDIKCDELIDICEITMKESSSSTTGKRSLMFLLAEFIIDILSQNVKLIDEYSQTKRVTLKQYLNSTSWMPVMLERPHGYPLTLTWQGSIDTRRAFVNPRDLCDKLHGTLVGGIVLVTSLDLPEAFYVSSRPSNRSIFDMREIKLDILIKQLKCIVLCYQKSSSHEQKNETFDYLNLCKRLYETLSHLTNTNDILNEMRKCSLTEWIWNSINGFSSINHIFLIDKTHPLASYVQILPYELYNYRKFFESIGVKTQPEASKIEDLIRNQQQQPIDEHLLKWIKETYTTDRRLLQLINDYELKSLSKATINNNNNNKTKNLNDEQTRITFSSTLDLSDDKVYLYLPDIFNKQTNIKETVVQALTTISKEKKTQLLNEEDYFIRKMSGSEYLKNLYDHYRAYNDLLLPNLNVLPKNVKDTLVLFALDHADNMMLNILKQHCCIPCTPNGRTLNKPSKLIHPYCRLASLYSDIDSLFPYGGQDSYLREDRLNVLKLLGMKCDDNLVTWPELVERCESIQRMRDYDLAHERSLALLQILNDMLTMSNSNPTRTFDESDDSSDRRSRQSSSSSSRDKSIHMNTSTSSSSILNTHEALHDKEARTRASLQLRELAFIPIKPRPQELNGINLIWMGDKYSNRLFKPKDVLSQHYEQLVCSTWPIAEQSKINQEQIIITKQVEHFLALDDAFKIEYKDILKQLDEISKLSIVNNSGTIIYNHQATSKYILDMSYAIYDYIQSFCFPHLQKSSEYEYRSSSMTTNQLEHYKNEIREFFKQRRLIYFTDPSSTDTYLFLSLEQLLWQSPNRSSSKISNHLKPYYYSIPISLQKTYKHFFLDLLQIKCQLEGKDLLYIIEQIKKKYGTKPIDKDDLSLLQNIYTLLIEQYSNVFHTKNQLYLPNVDCVLQPGPELYFYPFEREQILSTSSPSAQNEHYVHPSVDRRVCLKAGVKVQKNPIVSATVSSSSPPTNSNMINNSSTNNNSSRLFPKIFGNKKLESILARLDDPHINPQLVETMDESNPNIVLEFLLESNKHTQITNNLSDDDITIILKYFNDFLTSGFQGNFQKVRELKIFRPLWGIASNDDKQQPIQQCCSLENFSHVYILNEDWSNLIRRSFKRNFFTEQFHEKKTVLLMQKKIESLSKIFTHVRFIIPSDMEIFLQLCLPHFRKLDARSQANLIKYFTDDIDEKLFQHEKEQCRKQLHDHLEIYTQISNDHVHKIPTPISRSSRDPPEICPIYELYDPNIKNIRSILGVHHFPDEHFHTPTMLKFLKECGLRSYIPTDKCKQIMESIQLNVKQEGWTNEQRKRSKHLYEHLLSNWTRYDNSILDYKFLEPYQLHLERNDLLQLHEQYTNSSDTNLTDHFRYACIKLSDGELLKDVELCWTSSYLLPEFVCLEQYNDFTEQKQAIEQNALEFFKLNKKPSYALVQKNLSNLAKKFSLKYYKINNNPKSSQTIIPQQGTDETLISTLKMIYHYFQHEIKHERRAEIYKELEDRECIYSRTRRQFLHGKYFCLNLPIADEIPPFLFSLDQDFYEYKEFFLHIGVQPEPHPMLYGDILRKLSKVCDQDYLNSNELCKSLKAMECFFKYLAINSTINSQTKLPGLYLVTNDFKLVKSNDIVIMDDKTKLDYITKLAHDKFMFNPNERVLKLDANPASANTKQNSSVLHLKDIVDKIFVSQRPVLFTQKYEESFSITIPEDEESHRQRFLYNLERKYNQLLSSRHLHRCMARVIANHVARQQSPKIISMDDVENLIRQRLTFVKVTCVEYLETNLVYKKTQQKVDQSVDEKAVYLVAEGEENITLYISMKHTEQPYFTLCLARALSPCLGLSELQLDNSVMAALLATTIGQMSKFLNLVNVATEENILSTLKLQYIPSPGNVYGDDIEQLQQFNVEQHQILPGDLCVYRDNDLYIYCEVEKIIKEYPNQTNNTEQDHWSWSKKNTSSLIPTYIFICRVNDAKETQRIEAVNFYVLEHWSRIFDAVHTKPVDERESSRSSTASSSTTNTQGKSGSGGGAGGEKDKHNNNEKYSSSRRSERSTNDNAGFNSDPGFSNGFDNSKTYRQTSADSDSSSNLTSESQSESESAQTTEQDVIDKTELELTKTEIYNAVRQAFQLTGQERKKTVKKLLLKWHPDKNPGRERFAAEVFKHLRKQIDHFENDPLTSFFNTFNNFHHSPFSASDPKFSWNKHSSSSTNNKTNQQQQQHQHPSSSSTTTDDRFGSYDNLNKDANDETKRSYQDIPNGNNNAKDHTDNNDTDANSKSRYSPHRSSSFRTAREEWQYRRQHGFPRRHGFFSTAEENATNNGNGTNSQTSGGKESPNARRKRNYQQSEADRWLKQAQHDLESAYSDMHSSTGQVAYDWACYKCYRAAEKALKAYHYYKDTGKNMTADIPGLLIGVDNDVREIGYKLYKWIGDPNRMQYPNAARFAKIPAEVFTVSQAEQAIEYTKELLKKIEDIMYP
ncbi:unnamed protein product [Adineta steineri]|uniref:J domain-containing protein n=1 Tax=Adineta steineri TaxID=433720 RepID=A0A813N8N7_9BILA|nr:unnamed protein product [Adineta steineri]